MTEIDIRHLSKDGRSFWLIKIRRRGWMAERFITDFVVRDDGTWICSQVKKCRRCLGLQGCIDQQLRR